MLKRLRQAGRRGGQALHHPVRLIGTLCLALLIGLGIISWRLSRGPVELPLLAARIGTAASGFQPGLVVTVGHARLAWEGFHTGGAPLDLRLSAISLRTPKGSIVGAVSRLRVTLAPLGLLRGRIVPIQVIARRTAITLRPQPHHSAIQTVREMAARLAAALNQAPAGRAAIDMDQLRLIRIVHAAIVLDDRQAGLHLTAPDSTVTLQRMADGTITARARALFHADPEPGGKTMPVTLAYDAAAGHGMLRAVIGPGSLPDLLPQVGALRALRLPITINAALPFAPGGKRGGKRGGKPGAVALHVMLGRGSIGIAQGNVPVSRAEFTFAVNTTAMRLTQGLIKLGCIKQGCAKLAGKAEMAPPIITLTGTASGTADVRAAVTAHVDQVKAALLAGYWPEGLARRTRKFVLNRVSGGVASDGVFNFGISFDHAANRIRLDRFDGKFRAQGVIFKWLKRMPPLTRLTGTLHFPDKDHLRIHVKGGQVGGLSVSKALVVINGIAHKDQAATITGAIAGPVQGVAAMLAAPHFLHQAPDDQTLSAIQGAGFRAARGLAQARIILKIPIKKHLKLKDMRLTTTTHLTRLIISLPLGRLVLHNGDVRVKASFNQASMAGSGMIGDQPARFSGQLMPLEIQHFTLRARTILDSALLAEAGYNKFGLGKSRAPLNLMIKGIPGQADITLRAGLDELALALPAFGWSKPPGVPGQVSLALTLRGGKMMIGHVAANAPGLLIAAQGEGDAIMASAFDIGRSRASGKITPPHRPGAPWLIALAGPVLDLSGAVAQAASSKAPGSGAVRQGRAKPVPWRLRAAFDRLILRKHINGLVSALHLRAAGSGTQIAALRATALLAASHHLEISLLPARSGRILHVATSDAGALLQAFGIAGTVAGGRLELAAHYLNGALAGRALMTGFRLRHAPLIGKVLQGMTLYGLAEATSGPGLAFSRLVAPFSLAHQVLTIKDGRAFSASLGVTMAGQVDFARKDYNLGGTIVPAYALNSLPGRIPVLGRLFRAGKGSGVFSARYTVDGPFAGPHIVINPLAALAPGIFARIFGSGPPDAQKFTVPDVSVRKSP
jgi:hypothetical protein